MKTFFLTGVTGFLGSNLARKLLSKGAAVVALKRAGSYPFRTFDIASQIKWVEIETVNLEDFFRKTKINCLIHCATEYGRKVNDPIKIIEANLVLPLKLLHFAEKFQVGSFINMDTSLPKNTDNYSLSKKQFTDWLMTYSKSLVVVNLKLQNFYGYGDDNSKFVASVISQLLENVPRISLTKGEQKRDFIYIDDVVDAIIAIESSINFGCGYRQFEIGSGESTTIRDFVILAKKLTGNDATHLDFGAIPYRPSEPMDIHADTKNLEAIGWRARYSLREGLLRTISLKQNP
jgi:CDP-paratose synthetase